MFRWSAVRALELFFWRVEPVVESNDRCGTGSRRTWSCTNEENGRPGAAQLHTWLEIGLSHERQVYQENASPFFPQLLASGSGELEWIDARAHQPRLRTQREGLPVNGHLADGCCAWSAQTGP